MRNLNRSSFTRSWQPRLKPRLVSSAKPRYANNRRRQSEKFPVNLLSCCSKERFSTVRPGLYPHVAERGWKRFQITAREPQSYSQLVGAPPRLYRSRFLQVNTHFATFVRIYKICTRLHNFSFRFSGWFFPAFPGGIPTFAQREFQKF